MLFLFKAVKYMNTIWTAYLHDDFMIKKMSIKPSQFKNTFYVVVSSRHNMVNYDIVIGRSCVFPYNDDNVVLAWISCMRKITCFKMHNGVSTFL